MIRNPDFSSAAIMLKQQPMDIKHQVPGSSIQQLTSEYELSILRLSESPECKEDHLLVAAARILKVADSAMRLKSHAAEELNSPGSAVLHVRALSGELQRVKANLSPESLQNSQYP
jgi:hypothetical protein